MSNNLFYNCWICIFHCKQTYTSMPILVKQFGKVIESIKSQSEEELRKNVCKFNIKKAQGNLGFFVFLDKFRGDFTEFFILLLVSNFEK